MAGGGGAVFDRHVGGAGGDAFAVEQPLHLALVTERAQAGGGGFGDAGSAIRSRP